MSHGRGIVQSAPGPAPGDRIPVDATLQIGDVDVSLTVPVPITTEDPIDIVLTPTISTNPAYTSGDAIGGLLTFTNAARAAGGGGTIVKVVLIDEDSEDAIIDLVLFNQTFTATADNAAFDPSDADLANCIGYIDVVEADYAGFANNSAAALTNDLRIPFDYDLAGTSLFGQMVIREAATYTAVDDLTVKITVKRD